MLRGPLNYWYVTVLCINEDIYYGMLIKVFNNGLCHLTTAGPGAMEVIAS